MAGTLKLTRVDAPQGGKLTMRQWVFVPSGNYAQGAAVGVAGETLNFMVGTTGGIVATNPKGKPRQSPGGTFSADDFTLDRIPAGYGAVIEANAVAPGFTNVILRFFASSATEISAAAYPAGLLGQDVVITHISDKKNG